MINEDELAERLKSQMQPVTKNTPIAVISELGKIQLYPEVSNTGHVFYLKNPTPPHFYSSFDGRVETYNESLSSHLEWADTYIPMIIMKALQFLGVNIQSDRLQQYTEIKDQQKI